MSAPTMERRGQGWAELAARPLGPTRGWGPAWRLARRDLARHRGRTAAAAIMVLLPVLLASALAAVLATLSVSGDEDTLARMGAADVLVQSGRISGSPATDSEVEAFIGAPVLRVEDGTQSVVTAGDRSSPAGGLATDFMDARADGLVAVLSGSLPVGDEVALSPGLADSLGVATGDVVSVGDLERTVSGIVSRRWADPSEVQLFAPTGTLPPSTGVGPYWLADLPDTAVIPDPDPGPGSDQGLAAISRGQVTGLSRWFAFELGGIGGDTLVTGSVGITLVILEIALLAGPAFAVGVRQQQQTLALLAATGGDRRALRRVVLAQAAVVGVGASVLGAVVGSAGTALVLTALRYRIPVRIGPLDVLFPLVVAFVVIGVAAAVASAVMPAITASGSTVVGALTVRPSSRRLPWRRPLVGAGLLVMGSAMVWVATLDRLDAVALASVGVLALGIGMVLVVPLPVALLARVTTRLPLGMRLAGRESSRSAARSIAAVAAVAGASASLAAVLTVTASISAEERAAYVPRLLPGVTSVASYSDVELSVIREQVDFLLPGARVGIVGSPDGAFVLSDGPEPSFSYTELFLPTRDCPELGPEGCEFDWRSSPVSFGPAVSVLDLDAAVLSGYDLSEQQLQVLADGGVLVADWSTAAVASGTVEVTATTSVTDYDTGAGVSVSDTSRSVPVARYTPAEGQPVLLVGEGAARALDVWQPAELLVQPVPEPLDTSDPVAREATVAAAAPLRAAFSSRGTQPAQVYTEVGFVDRLAPVDLAVAVAAVLVLLGATFTATALALADARRDRVVLTAMGAAPRDQRLTAGSTASLIAGTGALIGSVVGLVPGAIVGGTVLGSGTLSSGPELSVPATVGVLEIVPWGWLALLVLGLPVFAGLVVAAVASGRPEQEAARMSGRVA